MTRNTRRRLAALTILLTGGAPALAQEVEGVLVDGSGSYGIAGMRVELCAPDEAGGCHVAHTDDAGAFLVPGIEEGTYEARVQDHRGRVARQGVTVQAEGLTRLRLILPDG